MALHVGTSGWSYDHWQGIVYPPNTPVVDRLPYYLARYDTVELNASYYHWPRDAAFVSWRERLPANFVMAVKASRVLTHVKKLKDPERSLERMLPGLEALGAKRGPLLVQLPPRFHCNLERLEGFLARVPDWLHVAVEFRDGTWHREEVFQVLDRFGAAYCVMSGAKLPCILRATAPFVYVRFHGPDPSHLYGGAYSDDDLRWWAERIREWRDQGHAVYAYFNNDWAGNAVRNADTLRALLGLGGSARPDAHAA
jgi:uncharacterized protein YecE (DUF72 family)